MSKGPGWLKRRTNQDENSAPAASAAPTVHAEERSAIPSVNGSGFRPKAGIGVVMIGLGVIIGIGMVGWQMASKVPVEKTGTLPGQRALTPPKTAEGAPIEAKLVPPEAKLPPIPVPTAPPPADDARARLNGVPPPPTASLVVPALTSSPPPRSAAPPAPVPPSPPSVLDLRRSSSLLIQGRATSNIAPERGRTQQQPPADVNADILTQRGGTSPSAPTGRPVGASASPMSGLGSSISNGAGALGAQLANAGAMTTALAGGSAGNEPVRLTGGPTVARGTDRSLTLKNGEIIKCVQDFAFSSEVAGQIKCTSTQDAWSADGKTILLDAGTEFYGEVRTDMKLGRSRMFALWTHCDTPQGVRVQLDSPAIDQLGRAGIDGEVDTHFWDRFGAGIFLSIVDDSLAMLAQTARSDSGTTVVYPQSSTNSARDAAALAVERNLDIPPTLRRNQGELINIYVKQDRYFGNVYELRKS